jgi:hypothetical protein
MVKGAPGAMHAFTKTPLSSIAAALVALPAAAHHSRAIYDLNRNVTLDADRTNLIYRFELEDPEHLSQPVTGELRSAYRPDIAFNPIACDLDNARRLLGE